MSNRLLTIASVLVLATLTTFSAPPATALAAGPPVTFTPGTGPLGSTLLSRVQFAALPTDVQNFMSSHRVGDTWTITFSFNAAVDPSQPLFSPPGPQEFYGWSNDSGCDPSGNCDIYAIRLDVGYAGLGWWTRATSSAQGNRTVASGTSVTQILHQLRHHWVSHPSGADTDLPIVISQEQAATAGSLNEWWVSGETSGVFQFVSWFTWDLEDVPLVGPVLIPTGAPGYYATFIASQQSQISDSAGRVDNYCFSEAMEVLTWVSSGYFCTYPTNPLP